MKSIPLGLAAALVLATGTASAGALDQFKDSASQAAHNQASDAMGGGQSAASGSALLSQLATGSLNLGSLGNVAGVMQYCQQQGYAPNTTETVKNQLMAKLGGPSATQDNDDYQKGLSGVLSSDQGHAFSLAGVKDSVGKRVCGMIAKKAASTFLGA